MGVSYEPLPGGKTRIKLYGDGGLLLSVETVSTEEALRRLEEATKSYNQNKRKGTIMNDFEETYGASYPHAKYQIGATISFPDRSKPEGKNSGRVLHVIAPAEGRSCAYVVTPDADIFPVEVFANEVIE